MEYTRICRICKQKKLLQDFYLFPHEDGKSYYRTECKKCNNIKSRIYAKTNVDSKILHNSRRMDKINNRQNEMTREIIRNLLSKPCHYCESIDIKMSIDRIDNNIGHTILNTVPACIRCNNLKGSMPKEAWLYLVPKIKGITNIGLFGNWVGCWEKNNV